MTLLTAPTRQEDQTTPAVSAPLRIYNPVQKDYATLLESSAASNGVRTLAELDLAPGGGNALHFHRAFSERFEALEGALYLQVGKKTQILQPGQSVTAYPNTLHRFFNPTEQRIRFLVELRPGHTGFEQALQIAYGLAADGKTNQQGLPTNLYHLAVIIELGDSGLPGLYSLLAPLLRYLATRARRLGIEQELIRNYCR
jgi:quercetin dioxygenase-like cupin family protein